MTHATDPAAPARSTTTALGATAIAADVQAGRVSAVDVARRCLQRIAELNPSLGAFETVDPPRVIAEAEAVDQRADRASLPLAGVPVAVKDNMAARGYPARHGCPAISPSPSDRDDDIVRRIRAAGAVVVGVSRMPELALWPFTQSRLGVSRQPDDPRFDPGGSTGGGAVAVAAGMAAVALGTDGGGSIRIPAAHCGLVGVKPGAGVLPLPGDLEEHWCGLTQSGYLTRSSADALLVQEALAPSSSSPSPGKNKIKIAVTTRVPTPIGMLWRPGREAVAQAEAILIRAGETTVRCEPPYRRDQIEIFTRLWHAGVAEDAHRLGLRPGDLEPRTAAIVAKGERVLAAGGPDRGLSRGWRDTMLAWMSSAELDVLLLPVTAGGPIKAGGLVRAGYLRTLVTAALRTPMTQAWNLCGFPVVVAPMPVRGRHVGVQLVGRPGAERSLIQLAGVLEGTAARVTSSHA